MEPEICNASALRQAARRVSRIYDEALAPSGVGLNQYSILVKLERAGSASIQELADLLVMDRSTLGRLLRPLEKRGLLKLEIAPEDRRSHVAALTRAGHELMARARPMWAAAQRRFEREHGAAKAQRMRRLLKSVAGAEYGL